MENINWGILAPGKIAHKFAQDIGLLADHELKAVGSRAQDKALLFAEKYDASFAGSYEEVMNHTEVDIIYIASPHHAHADLAIKSMRAGKHVLCEKPMAVNAKDVKKMIEVAKQEKVFLMEGLWSRFNPTIRHIKQTIDEGKIGDVNYINADFTFTAGPNPAARIDQMELAGGALLDVGIYPAFLSYLILGMPVSIIAAARFYETGADKQVSFIFKYQHAIANLMAGFISTSDSIAHICGSLGRIDIHPRWHESQGYTCTTEEGQKVFNFPKKGNGFVPEIIECGNCIRNHQLENALWSHQNSLDLISLLDDVRSEIGLVYPFES